MLLPFPFEKWLSFDFAIVYLEFLAEIILKNIIKHTVTVKLIATVLTVPVRGGIKGSKKRTVLIVEFYGIADDLVGLVCVDALRGHHRCKARMQSAPVGDPLDILIEKQPISVGDIGLRMKNNLFLGGITAEYVGLLIERELRERTEIGRIQGHRLTVNGKCYLGQKLVAVEAAHKVARALLLDSKADLAARKHAKHGGEARALALNGQGLDA